MTTQGNGSIRRLSVQAYQRYLAEQGIIKSIRTIRRWIEEEKIEAEKDPGGRNWYVIIRIIAVEQQPEAPALPARRVLSRGI